MDNKEQHSHKITGLQLAASLLAFAPAIIFGTLAITDMYHAYTLHEPILNTVTAIEMGLTIIMAIVGYKALILGNGLKTFNIQE